VYGDTRDSVVRTKSPFLLYGVVATVFAVLLVYSQTAAFTWDEGFHLLAAQLIREGKRPYLDFCFPQTPLNAYWNAAWMRILGDTWRAVHTLSALLTAGAVLLAADFIQSRFPDAGWRLPAAITTALVLALNSAVVEYATVGQAYAFCLFLMVSAFRVAAVAVERRSLLLTGVAGLLSAAAAASSLLTAAVAPVLLVWILRHTPAENRWSRLSSFAAGSVIPFLPVLWLFLQSPRTVFFNLVQYQLLYRRTNWEDATPHDLKVLTSWIYSPTAFLLGSLGVLGLWFVAKRSAWKGSIRAAFYLCGWLALAIGVELCATHPTFESYWTLVAPFLAIPAAAGLYAVARWIRAPAQAWWLVALLAVVLSLGLSKALYEDRNALRWRNLEAVARKVNEVTPSGAALWADEHVYFLTRRRPAEGTAFSYAEVIDMPEDVAGTLHIASDELLDRQAAAGMFSTVSTCEDQEVIERLSLVRLFRRQVTVGACTVFWEPAAKQGGR
jgi:4-amino-4-deoxy-L-arabinose transferase-like glycosyltransferase